MASASKSIPFVVPAQPVPAVRSIPQRDLARILELRRDIETLEADLKSAGQSIREQLEAGAPVERGLISGRISKPRNAARFRGKVWLEREIRRGLCQARSGCDKAGYVHASSRRSLTPKRRCGSKPCRRPLQIYGRSGAPTMGRPLGRDTCEEILLRC